jgi:hypothetical protein
VAPFILEYDQGVFAVSQKKIEERGAVDQWRSRVGDLILDKQILILRLWSRASARSRSKARG